MFGSHLSIAGSMLNALTSAAALSMDTVQVFTKNQQQWKAKPLDPGLVRDWRAEVERLGWNAGCRDDSGGMTRGRIVSHASYLINLASVRDELWNQSVDLMTDEVERCEQLGIPFLVHHPGSFVGGDLETGLANIARAYAQVFLRTAGYKTILCLEGTTGSGSHIGGDFAHLARLREMIGAETGLPQRVGFCLDTCHLHAAGYDCSTREKAMETIAEFDRTCGLDHLRVLHLNDSKGALGSKLDRHDHIGAGHVGGFCYDGVCHTPKDGAPPLASSGFAAFASHPAFACVPKIMETPKDEPPVSPPWDFVNLNRLRVLAGLTPTTAPAAPPAKPASKAAKKAPVRPARTAKPAPSISSASTKRPARVPKPARAVRRPAKSAQKRRPKPPARAGDSPKPSRGRKKTRRRSR